jgi:DNA-binding LacI/PurR family transcriptional regulator
MTDSRNPLIFMITNNVYGDSDYEQDLWNGASSSALETGARLCTFSGGQISVDTGGALSVPFLFQLAHLGEADGVIVNGGTLQTGTTFEHFLQFLKPFQTKPLAVTANEVKNTLFVGVDNISGMKSMIKHLITDLGARRIAYISGPYTNTEALDRLKAYREVLRENQIPVDEELIFEGVWTNPSGINAVTHFIDKGIKFDALAAANDLMAVDAMIELQRRGYAIPADVPVSGFDDSESSIFCTPKLSTVFQPISELSAVALRLVIKKIRGESVQLRELVPARLILRASAPEGKSQAIKSGENQTNENGDEMSGFIGDIRELQHSTALSAVVGGILESLELSLKKDGQTFSSELGKKLSSATLMEVDELEELTHKIESCLPIHFKVLENWKTAAKHIEEIKLEISEFRIRNTYQKSKQNEKLMNTLIAVNQTLNTVGSLDMLETVIAKSFPLCGVQTCHIVIFSESSGILGQAHRIASIKEGKQQFALKNGKQFPARKILDDGLLLAEEKGWVICPLEFEEQKLGYIAFLRTDASAFIYEALSNQVAALLHSILLIQQIEKSEAEAALRANRITELVRPMLATIESSGKLAREQGTTMANLSKANAETALRLSKSEKFVGEMQADLKKVISLTGTIDEISETVNIIAINAAIAAARAGTHGKVFSVISSEIRKLSVQSKNSTVQISNYLAILEKNSLSFFEANAETREVFSRLEAEIQSLLGSLERIQGSMSDMNGKAQMVLSTMSSG